MLEILPVTGIGDVRPGDDLAALIAAAAPWLHDGDIVVVTSKVVSKAEGRLVDVPTGGPERDAARDEVLAAETARPVARRGQTRVVQTHHGFVMASAGIDASNVDRSQLVLLPKDPDGSARALRAALRERAGVDVAVVVSDTTGRPWRVGLVDVALGVAGIEALRDHRGQRDAYGNELHLTQMAVADELASAAELVKGKSDRVPVAVVRGLPGLSTEDGAGAAVLIRGAEHDLFSLGTAEARAAGLRDAATLVDPEPHRKPSELAGQPPELAGQPPDPAAVARAVETVRAVAASTTELTVAGSCVVCRATAGGAQALVALGADLHRLRAALLAEGVGSALSPVGGPSGDRPSGDRPSSDRPSSGGPGGDAAGLAVRLTLYRPAP